MAWWNPIDWVKAGASDTLRTFDAVKSWTLRIVREAVDAVERDLFDGVEWVFGQIGNLENEVANRAANIWSHVADLSAQIYHDAKGWIADAEHYADEGISFFNRDVVQPIEREAKVLVGDAESLARSLVGDLRGAVVDFEHTARGWIDDAVRYVESDNGPIATAFRDALKIAYRAADDLWQIYDRDVVQPIEQGLKDLGHDLDSAGHWIATTGFEVAHLVEGAADWLEAMAAHGLTELEHLPEELSHALSFSAVKSYIDGPLKDDVAKVSQVADDWFAA